MLQAVEREPNVPEDDYNPTTVITANKSPATGLYVSFVFELGHN